LCLQFAAVDATLDDAVYDSPGESHLTKDPTRVFPDRRRRRSRTTATLHTALFRFK
jgi:hypothetical protein